MEFLCWKELVLKYIIWHAFNFLRTSTILSHKNLKKLVKKLNKIVLEKIKNDLTNLLQIHGIYPIPYKISLVLQVRVARRVALHLFT